MVALVGPTASGKSEVALRYCEGSGAGEILSCDSVQVYRGFDIGCAKPATDERARVRHHLIDVIAWNEEFDAQRYCGLALAAREDAEARGKHLVLCGGTGLYLRALRYGLIDAPERNAELRAALYAEEKASPGVLYQRLLTLDPATGYRTEPKNLVHVVRALEIQASTGELPSVLRARHGFQHERLPMRIIAIDWPRDVLRKRINARAESMVARGLVDEVQGLIARGVATDCRPMRAVGYREVVAMLEGTLARADLTKTIAQATWEYARRQYTWLRREKDVTWISATDGVEAIVTHIRNHHAC